MPPSTVARSNVARWDALFRALLAGPGAALATMPVVMGLSAALPPGPAGIDAIAVPLVALPLVWAALFFHACLDPSPRRAAVVMLGLCAASAAAIALRHGAGPVPVAP